MPSPDSRTPAAKTPQNMPIILKQQKRKDSPPHDNLQSSSKKRRRSSDLSDDGSSIYQTPASHANASVYETPATHFAQRSGAPPSKTPSRGLAKLATRLKQANTPLPSQEDGRKSNHIRFNSEDPEDNALEAVPSKANLALDSESEDGSTDDEAPEAITKSTAIESRRLAVTGAARAAAAQSAAAKAKRKQRDATLKAQAAEADKSSHRRKRRKARNTSADASDASSSDEEEAEGVASAQHKAHNIPLLPQSLLDATPEPHPPQPKLDLTQSFAASKRRNKLAALDPKAPKDVTKGPVKVRVLGDVNPWLPPKAEAKARQDQKVKEAWMRGRERTKGPMRGVVGVGRIERRPWGAVAGRGFLTS